MQKNPKSNQPDINPLDARHQTWTPASEAGVLLSKEGALADLAGAGVRRIAIEWDGLPTNDRAATETAKN